METFMDYSQKLKTLYKPFLIGIIPIIPSELQTLFLHWYIVTNYEDRRDICAAVFIS